MTTYFGWSVNPTASTLSSKVDDNHTQRSSSRTFPITNIQPQFFRLQAQKNDNSQPSNRRRAFGHAGQKYDSDTAAAAGWEGIFLDAGEKSALYRTFSWDSAQHNRLLGFLLVKQPGKIKHAHVLCEHCVTQAGSHDQSLLTLRPRARRNIKKCMFDPEMENDRVHPAVHRKTIFSYVHLLCEVFWNCAVSCCRIRQLYVCVCERERL